MNAQSTLQHKARAMLKHYSTSAAGAPARSNFITLDIVGFSSAPISLLAKT